eukprot:3482286-Rhodomonas_salina.2
MAPCKGTGSPIVLRRRYAMPGTAGAYKGGGRCLQRRWLRQLSSAGALSGTGMCCAILTLAYNGGAKRARCGTTNNGGAAPLTMAAGAQ